MKLFFSKGDKIGQIMEFADLSSYQQIGKFIKIV